MLGGHTARGRGAFAGAVRRGKVAALRGVLERRREGALKTKLFEASRELEVSMSRLEGLQAEERRLTGCLVAPMLQSVEAHGYQEAQRWADVMREREYLRGIRESVREAFVEASEGVSEAKHKFKRLSREFELHRARSAALSAVSTSAERFCRRVIRAVGELESEHNLDLWGRV